MDFDRLAPVVQRVENQILRTGRAILVIDGMAAAGKTTAAEYLSARWNAPVVHMDDFFLPPELRTAERLSEPGGNVHYERFMTEVLPTLRTGKPFSHRVFDCSVMDYGKPRTIPAAPVVIVEGAYAMHPVFGDYGDVTVFFSVDAEEQKRRILLRSGEEKWEAFRTRWIPLENAYHAVCRTRARAHIVL